jgi:hypothetical protein
VRGRSTALSGENTVDIGVGSEPGWADSPLRYLSSVIRRCGAKLLSRRRPRVAVLQAGTRYGQALTMPRFPFQAPAASTVVFRSVCRL